MFGRDSDFLRGGFRGVLNADLENRGIAPSASLQSLLALGTVYIILIVCYYNALVSVVCWVVAMVII